MKINLKECYGCRKPSVIWKNHEGFRYCKNCWSCHKSNLVAQKPTENLVPVVLPDIKKRPRIKLKSDKQKAELNAEIQAMLTDDFLESILAYTVSKDEAQSKLENFLRS